jgi:hypothetical protein
VPQTLDAARRLAIFDGLAAGQLQPQQHAAVVGQLAHGGRLGRMHVAAKAVAQPAGAPLHVEEKAGLRLRVHCAMDEPSAHR